MARKVQIEVTGPVQDPASGEVLIQPGAKFDEGAAELEGLPAHMLRPVLVETDDKPAAKADARPDDKLAASKSAVSSKST